MHVLATILAHPAPIPHDHSAASSLPFSFPTVAFAVAGLCLCALLFRTLARRQVTVQN